MAHHTYSIEQWKEFARQCHYRAPILAQAMNLSRRQLQRHTRKLFGRSAQDWLTGQRLGAGMEMLKAQTSIKVVAASFGFKQVSHFSRLFKDNFGLPPSHFRKTWTTWSPEKTARVARHNVPAR